MPTLSNAFEQELLAVGPFGGLDATTSAYYVAEGLATDQLNIVPARRYGGYVTVQGRVVAPLISPLPTKPFGLVKFSRTGVSPVYLAAVNTIGEVLQQFSLSAMTPATLTFPSGVSWLSSSSRPVQFVPYGGSMYANNDTEQPVKIDSALNVTRWQINPGTAVPTATLNGAGVVNSPNPYYYRYTFASASQESSPSPISAALTATNNTVTVGNLPTSADTQVTGVNVYRLGGAFGLWQFLGSVANGVATYSDNTADANITGQQLILHREPPPPFVATTLHKERVWGFGYTTSYAWSFDLPSNSFKTIAAAPSDLWYSNYAEPWGFDSVNNVLSIGRTTAGDIGVALSSVGSILVCFKTKSTWAVYGDTQSDFLARKLFDIGCVSQRSVCTAYGVVFWLSDQGVYMFGGAEPTNLSDGTPENGGIKKILDGLTLADLQASVGFIRDHTYYLSMPNQGVTYGYYIPTGRWHKIGWATDAVVYDLDNSNEVTANRISSPGTIDSWFAAETDLTLAISSSVTSRISDSGALQATKRYRDAMIQAPIQTGAVATFTITVDPGLNQKQVVRTVNLGISPPRHRISLPPNMIGFEAQLSITVTSSQQTEVQRCALYGWVERAFVTTG